MIFGGELPAASADSAGTVRLPAEHRCGDQVGQGMPSGALWAGDQIEMGHFALSPGRNQIGFQLFIAQKCVKTHPNSLPSMGDTFHVEYYSTDFAICHHFLLENYRENICIYPVIG